MYIAFVVSSQVKRIYKSREPNKAERVALKIFFSKFILSCKSKLFTGKIITLPILISITRPFALEN